jgi:serine/threonine protein kinase
MAPRPPLRRSELLLGSRFGEHELVRLLGHGATSSVFEAVHVPTGRRDAVKVMHEHLAADPQARARFLREGHVAAQLRHPNIVEVREVGVDGDTPYLAMELLEGEDLGRALLRRGHLPLEEAVAIVLPIADALAFAHDHEALHRDVKPGNVFLAGGPDGATTPRLVDFGLAKMMGVDDATPLTHAHAVDGTVAYMAPEQTLGTSRATPKSDQYSLAAVLFHAVTGSQPFRAESVIELAEVVRTARPARPSSFQPDLPASFDTVLLRALARDPAARFPSVRALARALQTFAAAGAPPSTGPRSRETEAVPDTARDASSPSAKVAAGGSAVSSTSRRSSAGNVRAGEGGLRVPPLPCAPGASPFHIKGLAYRGIVRAAAAMLPGGLEGLCDAIEDVRVREFLRQPFLAGSLYDLLPIMPTTAAIATLAGATFEGIVRTGTMQQVRYDAGHVYRLMFDGATVEDMPSRIPRFNARYLDFGRSEVTRTGPNTFLSRYVGAPAYAAAWQGAMMAAYTEEAARLAGANGVEVVLRTPTPSGHLQGFPLVDHALELHWR